MRAKVGMRGVGGIVVVGLLGSVATAAAEDQHVETTSYWKTTATVDALGIGLLVAGGFAEGEGGRDTTASDVLFTVGQLTAGLGAPIVHLVRGHADRAVGSLVLRGGMVGLGALVALGARSDCKGELCELDYLGYGVLGGFVVAAILDSTLMTTERTTAPAWTPQIAASAEGVRVGAAWTW